MKFFWELRVETQLLIFFRMSRKVCSNSRLVMFSICWFLLRAYLRKADDQNSEWIFPTILYLMRAPT